MKNYTLGKLGLLGLIVLFVSAGIPLSINAQFGKETPPLFEERIASLKKIEEQEPQYVEGEVLAKFKEGAEPEAVLQEINLQAANIERVHSIKPAVAKFKKDYKLEKDSDGWYWFKGKNYKEVEDVPDEEFFQESYNQMSPLRQGLYRNYKITLAEGESVEDAVEGLRSSPNIEYAYPNYIREAHYTPNDPRFSEQWALPKIKAPEAWDITEGSPDALIAIIDSGVDYNHEDLAENIWINEGEIPDNGIDDDGNGYVDDYRGWDFVSVPADWVYPGEDPGPEDNDPMDFYGHGTHCSGIAAAVTNNWIGIAGVAPNSRIMALRAGYARSGGGGKFEDYDLEKAILYAIDNGAKVISMSFGGPYPGAIEDELKTAYDENIVLVAAAGNDPNTELHYPAAMDEVIAVAATNANDEKALFSTFGRWVDVSAPGVDILSTIPENNQYMEADGTSMACPHVAGLAALLLSEYPEDSPDAIRSRIMLGADNIDSLNPGLEGLLGSGRINAYNSLFVDGPRPFLKLTKIEKPSIQPGETGNIVIHVRSLWEDASPVIAGITTDNQWVTVHNNSVGFYNVLQGETRDNSDDPFVISLSPDCPYGEVIEFNLYLISFASTGIHQQVFNFVVKMSFFKDVSEQTGLPLAEFVTYFVAMEDYNDDDYSDAYFAGFPYIINLYRNCQDGTFVEAGNEAGILSGDRSIKAVLFLDIDNDADKDLFLCRWGALPDEENRLYLNNGDGTFTDISQSSGVSETVCNRAIAFDYNNDGFVDICAAHDSDHDTLAGGELYLLKNNGDDTFTKVISEAGLPTTVVIEFCQMVSLDYDSDGNQDFLISDIAIGDSNRGIKLYRNNGEGIFTDVTEESGIDTSIASYGGAAAGDYNNDGYIDLLFTGIYQEEGLPNALYKNNGNGTFTDVTQEAGDIGKQEAAHGFCWGTDFFDYDNDGDLDLHLTDVDFKYNPNPINSIYRNDGGTFTDVTENALPDGVFPQSAPAAIGDYNNDGALDIYAPSILWSIGGAFLENQIGKENNWIKIKLENRKGNSLGYGARVYVTTGDLTQVRQVHTASVETQPLHFGLGQATKIDYIEVHWPSGKITGISNVDANQLFKIKFPLGDFDQDGDVDHADLEVFEACWHKRAGEPGYNPDADFNKDGYIDYWDLMTFSSGWNPPPTPVISQISPGQGRESELVTIDGTDFGEKDSYCRVRLSDSETSTYASVVSWSSSQIVFKVPDLVGGRQYKVEVRTGGGWSNYKDFYYIGDDITPPAVTITYPESYATVPSTGFDFKGTAQDPSGVSEVRVYVYDYGKRTYTVVNQLATYNQDTQQWQFSVLSTHMTPRQYVLLYVRAKDTKGNSSYWKYKFVRAGS